MSATAPLVGPSPPAVAGKHVVITGASGGIGGACALACARAGAEQVALIARSEPRLRELANRLHSTGARAHVRPCDITDTAALKHTIRTCGPADVLVNCAGANQPERFTDVSTETFDRLVGLNVRAAFFASQAAARSMIDHERPGVIVNVSSQMGHVGAPLRSVYCATKHALEGLTKALAVELAPHRIRVVSVAPTFVRTAMTAAQLDDPKLGPELLAKIPLGRFAEAEQVAEVVVFAASESAAMISGTSLLVDGGWTAQ
jgi:NAD(P)-dependent dehydrogenase (short-subunit alcohol dehydrogenase family)